VRKEESALQRFNAFCIRKQYMVITHGTLLQDHDRQKHYLSSLCLSYFITNHRKRMEPITPYSEKIDLCTEHGRKIYEAYMKALPVISSLADGIEQCHWQKWLVGDLYDP
jgi:hypothetical protein